jgi:hypothetical protein
MTDITFRSIAVAVPRDVKAGTLRTDEHGYTRMVVGTLGAFNSKGELYEATKEVCDLFSSSSLLQLQVRENALYGENGHPDLTGMNERQAMARFCAISEPNICTHLRSVHLDPDYYKSSPNMKKGEIAIIADLKPYGARAELVTEAMANPFMNLSYSIRCITQPKQVGGIVHRIIKSIITWDKVYFPGLSAANKRNALWRSSEAAVLFEIENSGVTSNINALADMIQDMQTNPTTYSTESISLAKGVFNEVQQHLEATGESYDRCDSIISMFKSM